MKYEIIFLGGTEEMGANSIYLYLNGTGIILDSGLHPKKRNYEAFPIYELLRDKQVDLLIISHAHTDHLGALPYLLKFQNHIQIISSEPTKDLAHIMLRDTAKLLKSDLINEFAQDALSLYKPETLEKIEHLITGYKFKQKIEFTGKNGLEKIIITLFPAGHILGATGVLLECGGKSIFYTSDVKFSNQYVIPKADYPNHHFDVLISESTNCDTPNLPSFAEEQKRISKFINEIVNENGSILIPVFALGKHQEILKMISNIMKKGSIPLLPIYTAGMSKKISRVYDIYTYSTPRLKPGFEFTDIPQEDIDYEEINSGNYFHQPSIVLVPSGMMNERTLSFNLAKKWMRIKNFGIAFVGYVDEDSPAYQLSNSKPNKEFLFGQKKSKRICKIETFRFSAHASFDEIFNFIDTTKPEVLFVTHGDINAREALAFRTHTEIPQTKTIIPRTSKSYEL